MKKIPTTKILFILSIIGISYAFMTHQNEPDGADGLVENEYTHKHDGHAHSHPHDHHHATRRSSDLGYV